jgi:hypothetical protein
MWTWYRPNLFMLIGLGIFNILWIYNLYRVWFHTEQEFKKNVEKMNNMPSWIPFRERFIQDLNDKEAWSQQTKLTSVLGILFLVLMDTLTILATIFGE